LGADVRDEKISITGWTVNTEISIFDFIDQYKAAGIEQIFCTDIKMDGAMKGPSFELYKKILERFTDLHFIASGGIRSLDDIYQLEETGCRGAIVGKAIYEGLITLKDLAHVN
jgi:phosphoribosylformimino-5-aminoimidazole carboxamide ribotide isomerase